MMEGANYAFFSIRLTWTSADRASTFSRSGAKITLRRRDRQIRTIGSYRPPRTSIRFELEKAGSRQLSNESVVMADNQEIVATRWELRRSPRARAS
jgi:hypothetical protein